MLYDRLSDALQREYETLHTFKETQRSTVRLICHRGTGRRSILRRSTGNADVYRRLIDKTCAGLPMIFEVAEGPEDALVLEEYIQGDTLQLKCETEIGYRFPLTLNCFDSRTGENVSHSFREKIRHASVAFDQPPDAAAPWRATEPAYHEARPDSALTTLIDHILESGDTRITWTLEMENGDVLRIHTDLIVTEISTVHYRPGDVPMGTMEEL